MSWPALGACFLVWLGLGVLFVRESPRFRIGLSQVSRTGRSVLGIAFFAISFAVIVGGFQTLRYEEQNGGSFFGIPVWFTILTIGMVFVGLQCLAVGVMMSLVEPDVTKPVTPPSINEGKDS